MTLYMPHIQKRHFKCRASNYIFDKKDMCDEMVYQVNRLL